METEAELQTETEMGVKMDADTGRIWELNGRYIRDEESATRPLAVRNIYGAMKNETQPEDEENKREDLRWSWLSSPAARGVRRSEEGAVPGGGVHWGVQG